MKNKIYSVERIYNPHKETCPKMHSCPRLAPLFAPLHKFTIYYILYSFLLVNGKRKI